jgi:hypothetical protein
MIATFGPPAPLRLGDVIFAPDWRDGETGWRAFALIGELEPVDGAPDAWRARRCAAGVFRDWQDLRSRPEARAFVAARVRMPCWRRLAA